MLRTAIISACGLYRYELSRTWDEEKPKILFIMLNPSTADDEQDDPTIRRCIGYAKSWGYGGILIGNLFAYRATDPKELHYVFDPVGPCNRDHLKDMIGRCRVVVCAWGNGSTVDRLAVAYKGYHYHGNVACIKTNSDGHPAHPLYLPKSLTLMPYYTFHPLGFNFKRP